jgi:uncharacterized OB-fold protein
LAQNVYGQGSSDLSSEFWDLLAGGDFHVQRCRSCGEHRFPPNNFCPVCHSLEYEWIAVVGDGTIYSYTLVRRAPNEEWAARVPYFLIIGELTEGPLVLGHLQADEGAEVAIGTAVKLAAVPRVGARPIYEFELVESR